MYCYTINNNKLVIENETEKERLLLRDIIREEMNYKIDILDMGCEGNNSFIKLVIQRNYNKKSKVKRIVDIIKEKGRIK